MTQVIHIKDGEANAFGRGLTSPSAQAPAARVPVISILRADSRRPEGSEDASSPDTFESLGELAVRLVANWSLPSCKLLRLDQRGK